MNGEKSQTLPYRTSGEEIKVFIEAVARKRDPSQIQGLFSSSANYQGTLIACQHLGFIDQDIKLLDRGKEYLLHEAERTEYLLQAILDYQPYHMLIEAIFARGNPPETTMDWIMNWWSTRGYGASQNNREEGAAALAKLLEFVGMGAYLIGRRGRPTRVEWHNDAYKRFREHADKELGDYQNDDSSNPVVPDFVGNTIETAFTGTNNQGFTQDGLDEYSTLSLALSDKRTIQLRIPKRLSKSEKGRLLKMIELMVEVEDHIVEGEV